MSRAYKMLDEPAAYPQCGRLTMWEVNLQVGLLGDYGFVFLKAVLSHVSTVLLSPNLQPYVLQIRRRAHFAQSNTRRL